MVFFTATSSKECMVNCMRRLIDSKTVTYKGPGVCWSKMIHMKVRCFVSHTSMGCIPMVVSLARRGACSPNQFCSHCNKTLETSKHLLLQCEFFWSIDNWIINWCGLSVRRFTNIVDFIDLVDLGIYCNRKKLITSTILFCLIWKTWLSRNDKFFKSIRVNRTKLGGFIISISNT